MPDRKASGNRSPEDRSPAQREADHASLALLSDTLVPALMEKLAASGLGELEVREGSWRIRLRRPLSIATGSGRRGDRARAMARADHEAWPGHDANPAGRSYAAGSPAEPNAPTRTDARAEAPYATEEAARSVATSPTVGVFRPEVAVGTRVQAGDRVGVVDLLGIPQDVPSPTDGILVEVFPTAGEAVEYGEAIAAVEGDPPVPGHAPEAGDPEAGDADAAGSPTPRDASDIAGPVAPAAAGTVVTDVVRG